MKKALLIVDVQNYFINKHTQAIPERIKQLLMADLYPVVCFSQFVNSSDSNFARTLNFTACAKPPYTDIVSELQPWIKADNVFVKDTYSVFQNLKFVSFLRKRKIDELVICGLDTDFCVLADCFNAFDAGFKVTVIGNCCASFTSGDQGHQAALEIIKNNLGEIINFKVNNLSDEGI